MRAAVASPMSQVDFAADGLTTPFNASLQQSHQHAESHSIRPGLDFNDHEQAFRAKSTGRLLQTLGIFGACGFPPFVRHALDIYNASRRVIGKSATNAAVRHTFFKQFCGGEQAENV